MRVKNSTTMKINFLVKMIMIALFVLGVFIFFADISKAAEWVNDPANCSVKLGAVDCSGGGATNKICGISGGSGICYSPMTKAQLSPTYNSLSQTRYSSSFTGGFILDCQASALTGDTEPYCNNTTTPGVNALWCNASSTCLNSYNVLTRCFANTWAGETGSSECATSSPSPSTENCVSGYVNCDGNVSDCEVRIGVTTCTGAGGLQGTYNASCQCVVAPSTFITGVQSHFSTSSPLLWGTQYGDGDLINITRNGAATSTFVVFNSGQVAVGHNINISTTSVAFEVSSTERGILIPRLGSSVEFDSVNNIDGHLYYNTTSHKFRYYNGTAWRDLGGGLPAGSIGQILVNNGGENWVTSSVIYVNTTTERVGIGTNNPIAALEISYDHVINTLAGHPRSSMLLQSDGSLTFYEAYTTDGASGLVLNNYRAVGLADFAGVINEENGLAWTPGLHIISQSNSPIIFKTGSTTERMIIQGNGNVGIGTTSPTTLLSVAGTSTLQNVIPNMAGGSGNVSLYSLGASSTRWYSVWAQTYNIGSSTWSITQTGTRFAIFDNANGAGDERLTILNNGNVGISTTTPNLKLTVDGGIYAGGTYGGGETLTYSGSSTKFIWYPNKSAFRAGSVGYATGGNYWDDANIGPGSVAMGIDTLASTNTAFAMGYNSRATGNTSIALGLYNEASGNYGSVAIGNSNTASGNLGSVAIGYSNTASGISSFALGNQMYVSGNYSLGINVGTSLQTLSQANTIALMGGNVGIGTTTPNSNLTVIGTTTIMGYTVIGPNDTSRIVFRTASGTNEGMIHVFNGTNWGLLMRSDINAPKIGASTGGSLHIAPFSSSVGDLDTSKGTLAMFDFDNMRVGIGTTTPSEILTIVKNGSATSRLQLYNSSGPVALKLSNASTTGREYAVSSENNGFLSFYDYASNSYRMVIDKTGNVGIGTTNPLTKLHLAGDGAILATGTWGSGWDGGSLGAGIRLMWIPNKAAFRAGYVNGTQWDNTQIGNFSTAFGYDNKSSGDVSSVAGGILNTASGNYSFVGGGWSNIASNTYSVVVGGYNNKAFGESSFVGGGNSNTASGNYSFVGGGYNNEALGSYSFIGGGVSNTVSGLGSVAFGINGTVSGNYSFLLNTTNTPFTLSANNSIVLNTDNININTNGGSFGIQGLTGSGGYLCLGNILGYRYVYECTASDLSLKKNIVSISEEIDVLESLQKLNGVYFFWDKSNSFVRFYPDTREIGLIAQEVEKVLPEVVKTDEKTFYKSVDYPKLTAFLIEVAKAQQAEIEVLRTAVSTTLNVQQSGSQIVYLSGDLDLKNYALLNVKNINSADNKWAIDEHGQFITRIQTSDGNTKEMFAIQSPYSEFVFSSSSQLVNGEAIINFDTSTCELIDETQPLKVNITLTGECNGIYVKEKSATGFVVKELNGGTSNATFDWMVIAKRKFATTTLLTEVEPLTEQSFGDGGEGEDEVATISPEVETTSTVEMVSEKTETPTTTPEIATEPLAEIVTLP